MSYLDDLDKCMAKADECIRVMEECIVQQHHTPYAMTRDRLVGVLKSVYHCLSCVKKKKDKLNNFKCDGGCIRPMSLTRQAAIIKRMPYIDHIVPELKSFFERNKDA